MQFVVKIEGLDKLTRGLDRFPSNLKAEFKNAMNKAAFLVEAKAKPVTPVDTGRLRGSIRADYIRTFEAAIAPHTTYAIFVHEGTRYMKGRPFMKWGLEQSLPTIEGLFKSAVDKALMSSIYY